MTKTAIIHARVSDRKQAEKELSIPAQIEAGQRRADELGAIVEKIFIEGTARSAWHGVRPEFEEALEYCELYEIDYFITWDTARFSRNTSYGPSARLRLRQAGTTIEYITVKIDPDTDAGFILEHIYQLTDELKSRQTSIDTRRGLIKNAKAGFWNGGNPPYGYQSLPDEAQPKRKRLAPHTEEAAIVELIFELKVHHAMGARGIALHLNEHGYTNRGKRWNKTVIGELLRNEKLIGRTIYGKKNKVTHKINDRKDWIIVESHPPVLDLDLWNKAQYQLDRDMSGRDTGSPHSAFIFTGLLKCHCGAPMQIESAKGRSRRYWYYSCRAAALDKKHKRVRVPAREFDYEVSKIICDNVLNRQSLDQVVVDASAKCSKWEADRSARQNDIINKLKGIKQKQDRLFVLLEMPGDNTPNLGDLTARLRQHNEQIKLLEQNLTAISNEKPPIFEISTDDIELLRQLITGWILNPSCPKKARDFLTGFITGIYLQEEKGEAEIRYNPDKIFNAPGITVPGAVVWLPAPVSLGTMRLTITIPMAGSRAA